MVGIISDYILTWNFLCLHAYAANMLLILYSASCYLCCRKWKYFYMSIHGNKSIVEKN